MASFLAYLPTPKDLLLAFILSLPILLLLSRRTRSGPITYWPLIGMLPSALSNLHRIHDFTADILRASGATITIYGTRLLRDDVVLTADPANVNHIFSSSFQNYPKGPAFAEVCDMLGNGIFNSDHESWKLQRKLAHGFMMQRAFGAFVLETSRRKVEEGLVALLSRASDAGDKVELQDVFLRFTFDTTCILVMGLDPGCLSPAMRLVPFAQAMDCVEEVILLRNVLPMCFWKLFRRLRIGAERRLETAKAVIEDFTRTEILKRKEEINKSGEDSQSHDNRTPSADLLTTYLNSGSGLSSGLGHSLGLETNLLDFLRDTMVNLILAGRDTTASGLVWFFYLVTTHPNVRERILLELRGANRKTGTDGLATFQVESLLPLVYLHATILETLRLYPPVPFEHKQAKEDDVLPSGHRVKKGLEVFISLYAMARMEGVWGKDCAEFKPERWINGKGRLRYEPSYKFLAFNSGPRTCLGKDMAMRQMKTAVAAVLWNFEMEVLEAEEVKPKVSIILHMKKGLRVRVRRRVTTE